MILKPRPFRKPNLGHPLARGLVGLWLMNEGSGDTIQDLSGCGNHFTESGGVIWVPGKSGPATRFDGDDDCLTASDSPSLDISGAISIGIWFRADSLVDNDGGLLSKGIDGGSKYFGTAAEYTYMVGILDNTLYWGISDGTNREWATKAFAGYIDGNWHYLMCVWDGANYLAVWVDGLEVGTNVAISTTHIQNLTSSLDIGGGATVFNYSGDIDVITLHNRFLTATERQQLYQNPFAMFEQDNIVLWQPEAGEPPAGNAGIMTTWGGYWGATY